jgi:hypothetical protein
VASKHADPCFGSALTAAGCQSGAAEAITPLEDRATLRSIAKFYGLADGGTAAIPTLQESLVYRGASASPKKLYSVSHGARQVLLATPIDAKRPLRCGAERSWPLPEYSGWQRKGMFACSVIALGLQAFERQEVR